MTSLGLGTHEGGFQKTPTAHVGSLGVLSNQRGGCHRLPFRVAVDVHVDAPFQARHIPSVVHMAQAGAYLGTRHPRAVPWSLPSVELCRDHGYVDTVRMR